MIISYWETVVIVCLVLVAIAVAIEITRKYYGQNKLNDILRWAIMAVTAAENVYETNEDKFSYVMTFLTSKFGLTPEEIKVIVDFILLELKGGIKTIREQKSLNTKI